MNAVIDANGILFINRDGKKLVPQVCINPGVYENIVKLHGYCCYDCPLMGQPFEGKDDNDNKGYVLECCGFSIFSDEPFYEKEAVKNKGKKK